MPVWHGKGQIKSLLAQAVLQRQGKVEADVWWQTAVSGEKERAVKTSEGDTESEHISNKVL